MFYKTQSLVYKYGSITNCSDDNYKSKHSLLY